MDIEDGEIFEFDDGEVSELVGDLADEEWDEAGDDKFNELEQNNVLTLISEEEIYDRYVPTDKKVVDEYLRQLDGKSEGTGQYLVRSETNSDKVRFNKSIVGMYTPPENFARVCEGVYRSSFPRIENFEFIKTLKLRSILCLIPEDYPVENNRFNDIENIRFFQIGLSGNKEPFVKIKDDLVTQALKIIIDPANQPVLIHCNRGKHRTGCIIGCLRKLQKWSHSMIFDEYRKFAFPKERPLDQQFIEMYNGENIEKFAKENGLLPVKW